MICFTVCACNKANDFSAEETNSTSLQATAVTEESTDNSTAATVKETQSESQASTNGKQIKPTKSTTTTKYIKPAYASTIDGYVTLQNQQNNSTESEPETVYVITDVKSNISGKTSLTGIELTVDRYSGAVLYVNYTIEPGNGLYQNSDFEIQKQKNGQWTDFEQIREIDPGKTTTLDRNEKYTYSLPEYYHLDKYFNNPENGRYKLKPNFCTDIEMKNSAGYEIEFTVTKQAVKKAGVTQKIENPVSADFTLAAYSTNYTYTLFDSRQIERVSQLCNNLKLSPIEKPETLYGSYLLTVIDGNGYEHSLMLYNGGVVVNKGGSYFFAENGTELFNYLDAIYMNT